MDDDEFIRIKRHHGERAGRPTLYAFGLYATAAIWMLVLVLETGVHPLYMVALVLACTGGVAYRARCSTGTCQMARL